MDNDIDPLVQELKSLNDNISKIINFVNENIVKQEKDDNTYKATTNVDKISGLELLLK